MGVSLPLVSSVVRKVDRVSNGVPVAGIGGVLPLFLMAGVAEVLRGTGSDAGWVVVALNVLVVTHVAANIGGIFRDGPCSKAIWRFHCTDIALGIMTVVAGAEQKLWYFCVAKSERVRVPGALPLGKLKVALATIARPVGLGNV
jgi:hypothetical protein